MDFYIFDRDEICVSCISDDTIIDQSATLGHPAVVTLATLSERTDQLATLTIECWGTDYYTTLLQEGNLIGFFDDNASQSYWRFFQISQATVTHGEKNNIKIFCESYFLETRDFNCYYEIKGQNLTLSQALTNILTQSGQGRWGIGNVVSTSAHVCTRSTGNMSLLQALGVLQEEYGKFVDFRFLAIPSGIYPFIITNRYIDYKNRLGEDNTMIIEFDKNMQSFERYVDTSQIKTAVYGRGQSNLTFGSVTWTTPTNPLNKANGTSILVDPTATDLWGYSAPNRVSDPKFQRQYFFIDEGITDANVLIQKAYEDLMKKNQPLVNYKVDLVDLFAQSGYDYNVFPYLKLNLNDTVYVQDYSGWTGFHVTTTVTSREVDLLNPFDIKVELGNMTNYLYNNPIFQS